MRRGNNKRIGLLTVFLLMLAGPTVMASGDHEGGHGNAEDGHGEGHGNGHGHGRMEFAFGEAAPAGDSDRTITITARDTMRFEPSRVNVAAGETVTFRVHNAGRLQHSFTLGTRGYQQRHDREMRDMPSDELAHHMDDSPNGMVVQPGETGTLTWRFEKSGPIEFACHIPGHYPAGMKGRLQIE